MLRPGSVLALFALSGCGLPNFGGQEGEAADPSDPRGTSTTSTGWAGTTGTTTGGTWTTGTTGTSTTSSGTTTTTPGQGDTGDTGAPPPATQACGPLPETLFLSPDDSNSMSSAALSRGRVKAGQRPGSVRKYEIFNYYDFDVPPGPVNGVSVTAEWEDDGLDPDVHRLQVMVGAEAMDSRSRPPLSLTLVLDTSGSMSGAPMDRQIEVCNTIAGELIAGDVVNMVTWSAQATPILDGHPVSGPNDASLVSACDALSAGGGTDLSGGLAAGYALAEQNILPGMTNRLMLMSDGGANLGVTDEDLIAAKANQAGGDEILMLGVGVGSTNYNDKLMDQVTDVGRGAAVFIDSLAEARRIFESKFPELMEIAVTDVRLELDLPEGLEIVQTSSEAVSTNPALVHPQHLGMNDEMVFFNELRTHLSGCVTDATEIPARVTYTDRNGVQQTQSSVLVVGDMRSSSARNLVKGKALLAYAHALQMANTGGVAATEAQLEAQILTTEALVEWPGDPDLLEVQDVLNDL